MAAAAFFHIRLLETWWHRGCAICSYALNPFAMVKVFSPWLFGWVRRIYHNMVEHNTLHWSF